jgi:hypothetical protein
MKPTNLTNIDFNEIRESIKSYLRTRKEFSDYDFTGSTLSYLLDVLAYNTYYSAFNANMALNELFLDTASIRDNVVSLSRMLNYVPRSISAARTCVTITVQTAINVRQEYPLYVTLQKGGVCSGSINGKSYTFVLRDNAIASVNRTTGIATFSGVEIYEGDLLTYEYIADTTIKQNFIIPNDNVDTSTLNVFVKPNTQSSQLDRYSLVSNITTVNSSSRVYFLSEIADRRYEVTFGDDIIGKDIEDGQVILFEYVRTNGVAANNISVMNFIGFVNDSDGNSISPAYIKLVVNEKSQLGDDAETLKSIKFNAPKYYSAQYRAVTASDYENITKSIYPNAKYVNAYGGESLSPPIYGKVFLSIKTKTGTSLNNLTKKEIIKNLKPYSMASVDVVIEDPDEILISIRMLAIAETFKSNIKSTTLSQSVEDQIKSKILAAIQEYGDEEDLNNFGKNLSLSRLQKYVVDSDESILDILSQVTCVKRIPYPSDNVPNTYTLDFGVELDCSCSTSPGGTVKSSVFYTTDKPGIPQYFEDGGSGILRSYTVTNNKKVYLNNNIGTYSCLTGKVIFGPVELEGTATLSDTLILVGSGTDINNTGAGSGGNVSVPTSIAVTIKPANPNLIEPGINDPNTIITLLTPDITVVPRGSAEIDGFNPGGNIGNPDSLSGPEVSTFVFTPPVKFDNTSSCFS